MKKFLSLFKGFIISPFLIYIYDLVASPLNLVVPLNLITILIVGFLGIPGLVMLLIFSIVVL